MQRPNHRHQQRGGGACIATKVQLLAPAHAGRKSASFSAGMGSVAYQAYIKGILRNRDVFPGQTLTATFNGKPVALNVNKIHFAEDTASTGGTAAAQPHKRGGGEGEEGGASHSVAAFRVDDTTELEIIAATTAPSTSASATPPKSGAGAGAAVGYDSIGGLKSQLKTIREMIELPLRRPVKVHTGLPACVCSKALMGGALCSPLLPLSPSPSASRGTSQNTS